jgi:hypothetical protein
MKLILPSVTLELFSDLIDSIRNYQHWSVSGFREKVSHRTVETSREKNSLAFLRHDRKGASNVEHWAHVIGEQSVASFGFIHRPQSLRLGRNEIDDAGNRQVLAHARKYFAAGNAATRELDPYGGGSWVPCYELWVMGLNPQPITQDW